YCSEVEEVLYKHPAVLEAAVIGLPDAKWGEAVHAIILLRPGMRMREQTVVDYCKGKMAGYKKPKGVTFLEPDEMPRTTTGKIRHRSLRKRIIKRLESR
ncbi:MAG: long-chain fatty acid--CoA ligase, partial [Thermoplasmata archaeon]|nr:long-chain fatty acid--CoA ligase [Thermoplasmata archaeon]